MYQHMTTKSAIIDLMTEGCPGCPLTPGEIANFLLAGGIETRSRRYASNVSAVLCDMLRDKLVERDSDGLYVKLEVECMKQ